MKNNFIPLKILSSDKKKEIVEKLKENYGIQEIEGLILIRGKERLFLFSGEIGEKGIKRIEESIIVERVGVYFAKIVNDEIKLSIEGTQILKDQIKKNIFELDDRQTEEWMTGSELPIKTGKKGFLIMKNKDNLLGSGKASQEKIGNFIPKSRRLKRKQ